MTRPVDPSSSPSPSPAPWYVTTPIYYVNDRPHIGHCFTTIVADVAARYERLVRGLPTPAAPSATATPKEVFFLTGTDEHADKVVTAAAARKMTPQAWADQNAAEFERAFSLIGCSHDDFIRTTQPRHKEKVLVYIQRMIEKGEIYKGEYTGWYDESQEEYVTETAAKESDFKSPVNGKPLVKRTEPCYFFKLSKYAAKLEEHIQQHPEFILPDARRMEVLGRIRLGLNDVPISRPVTKDPATQWGIRMPGDDGNRIYVWIDALFNYLTAVDTQERRSFWPSEGHPATVLHVMGKDILWFHAVVWPALLMAAGEALPKTIYAHGWWLAEGRKMSKSLGNFITLELMQAYAQRYSLDALRWYLLTQGPLGANDADFVYAKFVEVFNADLANGIGNSTSRVANMIGKYFEGKVPVDVKSLKSWSSSATFEIPYSQSSGGDTAATGNATFQKPALAPESLLANLAPRLERLDYAGALRLGTDLVRAVDLYINRTEPFKLAKVAATDPAKKEELAKILTVCAEALRVAALLLSPAMPQKMAQVLSDWSSTPPPGVSLAELVRLDGAHSLKAGTPIVKGAILFQRADAAEPAPTAAAEPPGAVAGR
jgi:methionyl-tRNA synthetase